MSEFTLADLAKIVTARGRSGDRKALTAEAADVLYHLLVMLEAGGVTLDEVMAELERRTAQTGLAEKASRSPAGEKE